MKIVDNIGLPPPVFEAIKNKPYDKGDANISITGLITPPRITQYIERLEDKIEQEAADLVFALDGTALHSVLELAASTMSTPDYIFEKRLYGEVDGWKISGQIDLVDLLAKKIQDYKRCSYWVSMYGHKPEWTQQLNGYRWLCAQNGIDIEHLEICAVYRDWSKEKAYRGEKGYPAKGIELIRLETWPMEQTNAWIKERVRLHQAAEKLALKDQQLCTPDERWEKKEQYAVELKERKSALRLLNSRADALRWMSENMQPADIARAKVVVRNGDPKRCTSWCPVRFHCDHGKRYAR